MQVIKEKKVKRSLWQYVVVVFVLYLPFQFALSPAEGFDVATIRLFIMGMFMAWLIDCLYKKKCTFPSGRNMLIVTTFLFFSGLSMLIAQEQGWAIRKFVFLLSIFPLYFVLIAVLHQGKVHVDALIKAIIYSGVIVSVVGICQFMLQFIIGLDPALDIWKLYIAPIFLGEAFSESVIGFSSWLVNLSGHTVFRAIALFPDPHIYSFFLELCFPWAVAWAIKKKDGLYVLFSSVIAVALIASFSRGAYVGIIFGSLLGIGYLIAKRNVSLHVRISWIVPIVVFVLGAMAMIAFSHNPIKDRFVSSFDVNEGSNEGRIYMWSEAYRISKDVVPLGVGIGNYPLEILPSADYREPIYAHNLYLDILVETGIFAMMAWIIWIALAMKSFIERAKENILYFGGFFALLIFSVHAFFDTPLYSVHILPLLLIIVALGSSSLRQRV